MIRPFSSKSSRSLLTTSIFRIREEIRVHPGSGIEAAYVTLDSPDCVNVVALTPRRDLVMVRQWRHGTLREELELPAGLMGEGETPLQAAARELREETGYTSRRMTLIGEMKPNTAYQSNTCFTVLAEGCELTVRPSLDPGEDIEVDLVPASGLQALLRAGRLSSALVGSSLLVWLDREGMVGWQGA